MGKKRDLANEHIAQLIDEIVDYESACIGNDCPRPFRVKANCPIGEDGKKVTCGECKEIYLEQFRDNLLEKYVVV